MNNIKPYWENLNEKQSDLDKEIERSMKHEISVINNSDKINNSVYSLRKSAYIRHFYN